MPLGSAQSLIAGPHAGGEGKLTDFELGGTVFSMAQAFLKLLRFGNFF